LAESDATQSDASKFEPELSLQSLKTTKEGRNALLPEFYAWAGRSVCSIAFRNKYHVAELKIAAAMLKIVPSKTKGWNRGLYRSRLPEIGQPFC
jgi:hypothetical protein